MIRIIETLRGHVHGKDLEGCQVQEPLPHGCNVLHKDIYFPNLNTALLISFYHHDKTLSPKPTGNGWADSSRSQHH